MKHCSFCEEPILKGEAARVFGEPLHQECHLRLIFGSVAHLERRCGCFVPGSMESDPLTMTKRQAARAAVLLFGVMSRSN
jgi:hypothetical protein